MKSRTTVQRLSSGIQGVDAVLGGGFMVGGIYIVQGSPGAGKTIFTNQLCFNHVASGGRALFVTLLAENHARMLDNMRDLAFFDESVIPDRLAYLSGYAQMQEGGMGALLAMLRREVQRNRTSVLVIDGLVSVHAVAESDQEFKQFVHDLQEIALATDCTMFLTTNDTRALAPERTMVDGLVVLTESLYGWQAVSDLQVTKFRGSGFLRGRHTYVIDDAGISVFPRIEALYEYPSRDESARHERIPMGIPHADAILGGGLPVGSTTIIAGPPGIGKTTMGLQFLARCSPDERGMVLGFHETPTRLRGKIELLDPHLTSLFADGTVEMVCHTPAGDLIDVYGHRLLEAVRRGKVRRLFIDGLNAFQNRSIDAARTDGFFTALANELRVQGVTTVYSLEMPEIIGTARRMPIPNASVLADNIVMLRFVEVDARLRRTMSVLKMRDSGFDGSAFEFALSHDGVHIDVEPIRANRDADWYALSDAVDGFGAT